MGFKYPMLAVPMGDNFLNDLDPDQSMNFSTKLLMEEWVNQVKMGEGMGSEAIFLETKLLEGLRLTEKLGNPNPLRTAMCCYLLTQVVREMKSYRPMMATMQTELLKSIYYDPGNVLESQQSNTVFLHTRPFFTLAHDLDHLSKESLKLQREVKLSRLHQISTQRSNGKLMQVYCHACFSLWLNYFREQKSKKVLLKSMMAKAMKGRSKDMLRERFTLWVQALRETKGDPTKSQGSARLDMLEKRLAKLQDESVSNQALIHQLKQKNALLEDELSQVRALEEQEQEQMEIARAKIEAEAMVNVLTKRLDVVLKIATHLAHVAFKAPLENVEELWRCLPHAHSLLELGSGKIRAVQGTEASRYTSMREKQRRSSLDELGLDATTFKQLQAFAVEDHRPELARISFPETSETGTAPRLSMMQKVRQSISSGIEDQAAGIYKGELDEELSAFWNLELVNCANAELSQQDIEDVVLKWVNLRLQPTAKIDEEDEEVTNFTSDWVDLSRFSRLVATLLPPGIDVGIKGPTPQRCFQLMISASIMVDPSLNFITVESVQRKDQDLTAAFITRLFSRKKVVNDEKNPSLQKSEDMVSGLNQELLALQAQWGTIKDLLDECEAEPSALKLGIFDVKVLNAKALLEKYSKITQKLSFGVKWARAGNACWETHRERARTFSFDILKNRVTLKSNRLKDAGNHMDSAFPKLVLKISDIFSYSNVEEEMRPIIFEQLEFVMSDNTDLLEQVFCYYRDDVLRTQLPVSNYRNFCKDTMIMDDGLVTEPIINTIFYEVTKEGAGEEAGLTSAVIDKVLSDPELTDMLADSPMHCSTEQFVEILIWTAAVKYREMDDMLEEKLSRLITTHIIPNARRYDSTQFTALVQTYANSVVLKKSEAAMRKKFAVHAIDSNHLMEPALSLENFKAFLTEHKIDGNAGIVNTVFANCIPLKIKNEEHACLAFEQLQEALCALCLFKNNNPFRPFEQRLAEFIKAMPLKSVNRRGRAGGNKGGDDVVGDALSRTRARVSVAGKMARRVSLIN